MAASHGSRARTYVSGRNLSGYLSSATQAGESDSVDVTVFASDFKTYIQGLTDGTFSGEGVWDAAGTVGSDDVIQSNFQSDSTVFTHYPAGDAVGSYGIGADGIWSKYEIDTPVDGANRIKLEAKSNRGFERVESLQPLTAGLTGAGTAASVDDAAQTLSGGAAYVHVTALSGGTAEVKVEHSANNSSWSDLATFSAITSDGYAAVSPVSGTVKRYLRASWSVTGGTATIHAAFARVP